MNFLLIPERAWEPRQAVVVLVLLAIATAGTVSLIVRLSLPSLEYRAEAALPGIPSAGATPALSISEPMVSFNFDHGLESAYVYALPIFEEAGFPTTQYIITGRLGYSGYVNESQLRNMYKSGHEIGTSGRSHSRLTSVSDEQLTAEIEVAKKDLENLGIPPSTFGYPYGAEDERVRKAVAEAGFIGARENGGGANGGAAEPYALRSLRVGSDTTFAEVKAAIDSAIQNKEWLILVFTRVNEPKTHDGENVPTDLIRHIVNYVQVAGIRVVTNEFVLSRSDI